MTASAVAGLLPFPLTVLVLWTAFVAVQQTACMPVQPPPSPAHGDGTVPPWYPNTQPNSTTKVDVVDEDPATTTPASSSTEGLTTTVSGGTHTTGRLPTTMAHPIPNSTTQDGVYSTSTRETTALLSTTGTRVVDVTTDRTGHAKNATITVTPPPDERTGVTLEQGGEAKMTTPASKATEATSVSEVIKVSESADGRSGKGLMHSWQGDDSSVFERATKQPQMSDGMGRNGESYQATTTDVTAQQTDTKPDTTPLHTTTTIKNDLTSQAVTSMRMDTTRKPAESSHQEESTQTSSDPKTVQSQSTTADPTTANSLSTTVGSTTTQSQHKIDTTTTHSPSMRVDLTTTQSPSTMAGPASVHQTQVTSIIGQSSKAQQPTAPREHGVSVSSQTAQTAAETTTLRPTEEMTQKHDILQPALPAHTDEREEVATIGTNQELPEGWQRDGGSVQDGGRSKNVEETGQSGDMEQNTTNRNVPAILSTEPGNVQTTQIMPTSSSQQTRMAQTIHLQTTTGMPDGTEQSTQKIQPTTPRSENDQGVTQRLDKDQRSTTLQTTVAISSEDRIATDQSAEMEQKLTTAHPTKPSEDDHQLTTSFSVQPSSAETSTVTQRTQNENLQTEQQQTKSNNDESSPTTTLPADTQSITTTSTAKATTEMMPTEVPRYLEAEVLIPEEVTVQERQGQEEHLDKEEQPTVSSSQDGGDDSWQQHVEVMVPADVLCEQVPDGMAELPLFADSSVSGLHTDVSLEDIYQGSGDISVQSESTETSEEITEDAVGQYGMDETTVATTAAMSDEAFERIESGESLQDEGEHAEAMSLFTDSKAEQTDEEKTKESKQEEGSKVQEELSEKPVQVMELVTEPSNQDKETTEHITQSSNEVRETTEYVTQPSNQDRETTAVYKPPSIVTYGPFDPLLADEQGEGILPTDLTVSSKDERGSASDKQDSMLTNLQETTTQTTTGVVTTDDRMATELTSAAPSKETTVTTDTLFTKEEEQKVISFVSTIPVSTSTTVAKMTSGSSARTSETSTAVESASTTTVHPTTSIGATTKMSKTTERPVALTTTDRQATTSQADPLDSEMFTSESDLVAHMIGKITANQEGPKTESLDESKVESSTVDTTLNSTLPQTTEADFLSTQTPFSEEDGTTVRNTLTVESTEEPKASEKESSTYEASDIAMEATQAVPRIENTTLMVANAKNMQDLTTDKAESSSSETKSSTKIPSSMKTVTMSSSGVKEVLPTRNAPALRDIITVKLSKMVEVVTEPTMASTEQTRTTTTKSAPGASTLDTHVTTVSPAVTAKKLMGSTDKPKMMTTRGTETTSVHAAPTEHTTTTTPVAIAVQTSNGNNGKEEEESLHVDGSYNTSNQTEEMLNTPSHATAATVQPTSAAVSEKHMKTTDISAASQLNVEVTTTFPKTSTVQPALVTTPKVTVRQNITSAETTKETSMPVLSTKTTVMQKVEEPRRLPAIITVLTAQPPVHMPVATDEPNFSTKLSLPESTDPTSTSVVTDPIPQTTVKPTTSKTVAEREKNVGKMTETTSVPTKPTEARTQGITTTEPMKDITTEGTVSLFTSDMVTSTAVTEVSTAFDDVEILDVDQSASGGETAGSLYLDKYPDTDDNAVVPFQKEGDNVEKKAPLDTTSTTPPSILPTEEMDMTTELTTKMTPRPTEPITLSPATLGGSDQQDNIPSSTEQHTAEMTTKATTTTTKFSSTKQSEAQPTTTTQRNIKTTSSTNMSTTYVPPTPSEFDSETTKLEHTSPKTSLGATTGSSKAGNQTVLDTTVLPTSLPTTSTNVDKTQQPASPPTAVLTTSIMIDRESETSTRVQEIPENERHLPAVINVLTMRPITTTPGTTTVQPNEATKKDSVTTSTALSSTERKNLMAEKVLSASATTAGPQTTEKTFSTEAMLTTESPLYRTTTIPQTDVTDKTDDRTPTAPLSIISSDQSAADKAAGSLHEGQPPDNKGMIPTTEQNKGKDVSSTSVTPSSATETSANLFPTTQGKMSSTLKTTESPTTQGMPLTTSGSASGSKQVEGEVTDESTRQIAKTTKSPETRTLSNPATTSLLVLNKESDTLEETTDGTTEEILTANTIARSEDETTAAEPSITQTLRSTTPTVPGGMPVRNAAAIITVLTARPPRVQTDASFPTTTSSTTTEKASTVAPVEIVEGTTSEHIPMSVMTTEMLETSTSAVHDKTNNPTEDTTTVLSRSTPPTTEESVPKGGPLSVTEKIMLEKDLNTIRETAMTSEMLSDISEETTVTLAQVTGFQSTSMGETTKSTLLNTQTTRKLSTAPETTTTLLPETTTVLTTTQSVENANRESQVKNAGTTSQASGKAASNGTAVISETSTLAPMTTTTPKKTTHTGDDMTNTDKTATTSSASTVTTMKETEITVAMKDAALRKMSTTEAPKTTTAETTARPTDTARSTSTRMMDKRQEERSTPTVTAKPESEAPQGTTRMSTPEQKSTEKMVATTTSGIEPTTRGEQETTTLPAVQSTSETIQVVNLEDEAETTELTVDGRVPL